MVTWYWIENSISQECKGIRSIALFASAIVLYVLFHCTVCLFDKSHPSKCFSYESISLFWYIPSFTSWKYYYHCTHKHSLFVYCFLYIVYCILYIVYCILYIVYCIYCILYTVQKLQFTEPAERDDVKVARGNLGIWSLENRRNCKPGKCIST
jgi:hypothetical protein